jgi:hypothetical protein
MPRLSTFIILACIGAAFGAGCGSVRMTSSGDKSAAAISMPSSSGTAVTKVRAIAFARAVNLRAADVPESVRLTPEGATEPPTPASIEFARCVGATDTQHPVVDINSSTFASSSTRESARVKSSVLVMPNAMMTARNSSAVRSAHGRACAARIIRQALPVTRYGSVSVSFPSNVTSGVSGGFEVRVATIVRRRPPQGRPIRIPVYTDEFGFNSGPAEVYLTVTGFLLPVSATIETRLLLLLRERSERYKL